MSKKLTKGNVAVVKGAILAGCRAYYGYPITPASEIAEAAAYYFPKVGGTFLQAESEVAAINMVYGAAATGTRVMTASSGPGLSLMQEGLSYLAGAELPCVVADIMRAGPGLGNIGPEQGDYFQMVKGGGHGNYHNIVLAPNSAQEMCDFTMQAFEIADRLRNPVIVLTDGFVGQMMEPVKFSPVGLEPPANAWAVQGNAQTRHNLISSIHLRHEAMERHVNDLEKKYAVAAECCTRHECYRTSEADIILVGYGIVSRILRSVVDQARAGSLKVGLFRPISLWPFPGKELRALAEQAKSLLVCELSWGQMLEDVRLAVGDLVPIHFHGRKGGMVPTPEELLRKIQDVQACVGGAVSVGK
ncbi:MAG TPA: 3-methyl-2-oxobutanoate dehydrogenase subunit VorB [Terriglobia bacterium]|nr:3-methyl-2-oxobutanoate dehydrogenase subunit VorB [Terriglobia bacterium]